MPPDAMKIHSYLFQKEWPELVRDENCTHALQTIGLLTFGLAGPLRWFEEALEDRWQKQQMSSYSENKLQ